MSVFHNETIVCPLCGTESEQGFANSVNADRRPDFRDAILDQSFQRIECPACRGQFRFAPHLTYLDSARGQWILTMPATDRPYWESLEAGSLEIFNDAFGPEAPRASQLIGARLVPRVTFGWMGLREKLLCHDLGLNDAELELLKVLMMRTIETASVSDRAALRLLDSDPSGALLMGWVSDDTEAVDEIITVPRDLLDDIRAQGAAWDALRAEITNGTFVDATRLLVPPALPVA